MKAQNTYLFGIDALIGESGDLRYASDAPAAYEPLLVIPPQPAPQLPALVPFHVPSDATAPPPPRAAAPPRVLKSELPGVSDQAWQRFAMALKTAAPASVSDSNALGAWQMRPRRLADLGLMENLRHVEAPSKRMAWVGDFVAPLTKSLFLDSPTLQYRVFAASMRRYADALQVPKGMSKSGALAILHRCGPSGLKTWQDKNRRFSETVDLFTRANGIF